MWWCGLQKNTFGCPVHTMPTDKKSQAQVSSTQTVDRPTENVERFRIMILIAKLSWLCILRNLRKSSLSKAEKSKMGQMGISHEVCPFSQ